MPSDTKRHSRVTTEGMGRAPNRAMLRAVGFLDNDFTRPMVGVASLFSDITPCNAHLDRLARKACEGIRAAGGVPQIFGAPAPLSDAFDAIEAYAPYIERELARGTRLHEMTRHLLGLFAGRPGARPGTCRGTRPGPSRHGSRSARARY